MHFVNYKAGLQDYSVENQWIRMLICIVTNSKTNTTVRIWE